MGLFDKIQAKLELYRLEQRYTRRTKRTTFISGAEYVNGEYVYPNSHNSSEATSPISLSKNSTGSAEREFWRAPSDTRSPTLSTFEQHWQQQRQQRHEAELGSLGQESSSAGSDRWARG